MFKRGQGGSNAAVLILLIAGFILLYILFLPPNVREDLLRGGTGVNPPGGIPVPGVSGPQSLSPEYVFYNATAFQTTPGRITYLKTSEYEHPLPSVNLFTTTQAIVLLEERAVYVRNGIFDVITRNVTFTVQDPANTHNLLMSFNFGKGKGRLMIDFNGRRIFDGELTDAPAPIPLSPQDVLPVNTLAFSVSEVGYKFWTTNEYELRDVKLTADITDISDQTSRNTFIVSDVEKLNTESATLQFLPDCNPHQVGMLGIFINNENVYSSVPDCGQKNIIDLSSDMLTAGTNRVVFTTMRGNYLIYDIHVKTKLRKQVFPVYYFDMDQQLFLFGAESLAPGYRRTAICGDVDGVCPSECDEDLDVDCCSQQGSTYWCDVIPENKEDRCRALTSADHCALCPSGYEDRDGKPKELCRRQCGDDTDGACPSGCNKQYDQDCCFAEDEENYWCNDIPRHGVTRVCEPSISQEECGNCPRGYISERGSINCKVRVGIGEFTRIKPNYRLWLTLRFVDDKEYKAANVYVNGHKFYINTYGDNYYRDISDFVEAGSNAIKIEPDVPTLDVRDLRVNIEQR